MKYALVILCFVVALNSQAQTTQDSVKATINNLFEAMKNSDTVKLNNCFANAAIMQTIVQKKNGEASVRTDQVQAFAASIASLPAGAADERITFDAIKIDGPLATVWTPYHFYYNGKFLHCGVNHFVLIQTPQGWKIQYIIDTRRTQGCTP